MKHFLFLIILTVSQSCDFVSGTYYYSLRTPTVSTDYGLIVGNIKLSRSGTFYEAYTGIPYAKPPVGKLRFKEPQPLQKNPQRYIYARNEAPLCIQKNYLFANPVVRGQEDCLYLNVYVPQGHNLQNAELLPVMVFIHWGAFIAGYSGTSYLGPEYFMDKNVILVTFNYRLGPFGFLTTLDDVAPGNYALKDQVLALKWVQENIENFKGNSSQVTLFGQSAGGGSVQYHLLSQASKGLFHQAISQSGSALAPWAMLLNDVQVNVTAAQAVLVGCTEYIGSSEKLLTCLRNVSAEAILNSQDNFKFFSVDPLLVYTPVVEKQTVENPNPFFTKQPLEYIKSGEFQKIPWITGTVRDEGILRAANILRNSTNREALNANFKAILPQLLALPYITANPDGIYENITKKYLQGQEKVDISKPESVQGFIDIYSDVAFAYPLYQSVLLQAAMGQKPIWVYNFNYKNNISYGSLFAATDENIAFDWGVSHCDDLLYLFNTQALLPQINNANDVILSTILTNLWTNFAIYGNPNPPENNQFTELDWVHLQVNGLDNMTNENIVLLNITGDSQNGPGFNIGYGFYKDRMKFWSESDLYGNFKGLK